LCQLGHDGRIYRLARTGHAVASVPRTLSKTGAFRDLESLGPAPGLVPYDVNPPLWSDGAAKSRWVAVPSGGRIGFAATGPWSFPDRTAFVKHFKLGKRRLETRFLVRSAGGGAYGLAYRWRPDGLEADLLDDGSDEPVLVKTDEGERKQTWHYPGCRECLTCHTPASGHVLGVNTRQLHAGDRLASWARSGFST
jgi:hypothetical protein